MVWIQIFVSLNFHLLRTSRKACLRRTFLLWRINEGYLALACRRQHIKDGFLGADTITTANTSSIVYLLYLYLSYHCVHVKASTLYVIQTNNDWSIQTGHAYGYNIVQVLLKKGIKQIACKYCHKISK